MVVAQFKLSHYQNHGVSVLISRIIQRCNLCGVPRLRALWKTGFPRFLRYPPLIHRARSESLVSWERRCGKMFPLRNSS